MEHTMFLTQIIGCITAALIVAVLWLGVELHGVKRESRWLDQDMRELRRDVGRRDDPAAR